MNNKQEIDYYYDLTDDTLVNLTLLSDNRAFEELVKRYQRVVTASVRSVMRNASLAEDIVQDAFVSAWTKLNTLKEPDKFGAWVCRIAKNKAKNHIVRYREYISFDMLENVELEQNENCGDLFFAGKDEYDSLILQSTNYPTK